LYFVGRRFLFIRELTMVNQAREIVHQACPKAKPPEKPRKVVDEASHQGQEKERLDAVDQSYRVE
jgi:hypothetical protein